MNRQWLFTSLKHCQNEGKTAYTVTTMTSIFKIIIYPGYLWSLATKFIYLGEHDFRIGKINILNYQKFLFEPTRP